LELAAVFLAFSGSMSRRNFGGLENFFDVVRRIDFHSAKATLFGRQRRRTSSLKYPMITAF
jgi:hypothetical protein